MLPTLPNDVIDHILSYMRLCDECGKYVIESAANWKKWKHGEFQTCFSCFDRYWYGYCDKCEELCAMDKCDPPSKMPQGYIVEGDDDIDDDRPHLCETHYRRHMRRVNRSRRRR